jgi:hypothetical protein
VRLASLRACTVKRSQPNYSCSGSAAGRTRTLLAGSLSLRRHSRPFVRHTPRSWMQPSAVEQWNARLRDETKLLRDVKGRVRASEQIIADYRKDGADPSQIQVKTYSKHILLDRFSCMHD